MMSVTVKINHELEIRVNARRVEDLRGPDEVHEYIASDGRRIFHRYSDGLAALAIKLLEPAAARDAERRVIAHLCERGRVVA